MYPTVSSRRPVVTGMGCVTPLGPDLPSTWARLIAGDDAAGPLTVIPTEGCRVRIGAEASLPSLPRLSAKALGRLSRASRLALPAAAEALSQAGLLDGSCRSVLPRLEMAVSTTACGMEMGEAFLRAVWSASPRGEQLGRVAHYQAQQQIAELQRYLGFSGPAMIVANACASGANAIGHAADLVRCGMADIVLSGGYEALCDLVYTGFDSLQALAPDRCRPFDRTRRGLMLGEGAAFLVIEAEGHARARGARPIGSIAGYGHTTDTFHLTQPAPDGAPLERALRMALGRSGLDAAEVGYINAHGTGTPFNDAAEAAAFSRVFGADSPARLSSTKAAIGHTLGAAGSIEAIFSLMAIVAGELPPQLNSVDPEPLVASRLVGLGEQRSLEAAVSVNLGFGGSNAALVLTGI